VQALDLRPSQLRRGLASQVAYDLVRRRAPMMEQDGSLFREMTAVAELIHSGELPQAVAHRAGSTVEELFG
jgi:histidine ammonia-lyase